MNSYNGGFPHWREFSNCQEKHSQNLITLIKFDKIDLNCVVYYQQLGDCDHQSEYMTPLSNTVNGVLKKAVNVCVKIVNNFLTKKKFNNFFNNEGWIYHGKYCNLPKIVHRQHGLEFSYVQSERYESAYRRRWKLLNSDVIRENGSFQRVFWKLFDSRFFSYTEALCVGKNFLFVKGLKLKLTAKFNQQPFHRSVLVILKWIYCMIWSRFFAKWNL